MAAGIFFHHHNFSCSKSGGYNLNSCPLQCRRRLFYGSSQQRYHLHDGVIFIIWHISCRAFFTLHSVKTNIYVSTRLLSPGPRSACNAFQNTRLRYFFCPWGITSFPSFLARSWGGLEVRLCLPHARAFDAADEETLSLVHIVSP